MKWVKLTSTKIYGNMSYTFVAADPIGPSWKILIHLTICSKFSWYLYVWENLWMATLDYFKIVVPFISYLLTLAELEVRSAFSLSHQCIQVLENSYELPLRQTICQNNYFWIVFPVFSLKKVNMNLKLWKKAQ